MVRNANLLYWINEYYTWSNAFVNKIRFVLLCYHLFFKPLQKAEHILFRLIYWEETVPNKFEKPGVCIFNGNDRNSVTSYLDFTRVVLVLIMQPCTRKPLSSGKIRILGHPQLWFYIIYWVLKTVHVHCRKLRKV